MTPPGTLYLLPMPLGAGPEARAALPSAVAERLALLRHIAAEAPRSAPGLIAPLLKGLSTAAAHTALADLAAGAYHFYELSEHRQQLEAPLALLRGGTDVGLMSEAGLPAVADPGAELVRGAHALGARVEALSGPSSLLLALAASGLGGQRFAFHGYLPRQAPARAQALRQLEADSRRLQQTQLCIEAPYRNAELLEAALATLAPTTWLCVAAELSLPQAQVISRPVGQWARLPRPELQRRPAVFAFRAEG